MNFQPRVGMNQDPRWHEISASLRSGKLWVKLPRERCTRVVNALNQAGEDLLRKETYENGKSFFFVGSIDDWNEDLLTLEKATLKDPTGALREFTAAVAAGLRNDPEVDWVARIGGPDRQADQALEALQTVSEGPAEGEAFTFPIV